MAARVLKHHNKNPYNSSKEANHLIIYQPNDYYLNILVHLSAPALRCWTILTNRLQYDGSATVTLPELHKITGHPVATCNKGILELAHWGFIQKRGLSQYWVNPSLCRVLQIQ